MTPNTISAASYTVEVPLNQRPFSNNFVMLEGRVVPYAGEDEIQCVVRCTEDSNEPGREYMCAYTLAGELVGCNTLN